MTFGSRSAQSRDSSYSDRAIKEAMNKALQGDAAIVNLQLPNKGFNQDILILVVPHIEYHNFVPITLGTHTLEAVDEHLVTNNLVQNL